jgi:cytosine/adenosine deaminase-related metal-dependent hydrolase
MHLSLPRPLPQEKPLETRTPAIQPLVQPLVWHKRALLALLLCLLPTMAWADFVIANARVLTLADGDNVARTGYVLVRDGRIAATGEGELPATLRRRGEQLEEIDATGRIVIPGFVSGHNHLWQSAFRGIAADGELYPWLQALHWTYGSHFGDGDLYAFTLHGALDQLMHGITTTYSHSQRLGATEAQYLESFDASVAAGHHFVFAYNANLDQPLAGIERDVDAFVARSKAATAPGLLGLSMNAVGLHGADPAKFVLEMKLARRHGMTTQIHYLEQYTRRFGERRQWPALLAAGAVAPDVSFAHFIHTTDHIVADTARLGGTMIWNPLSNGRLASGLADILQYQEAGIRVGMGVDGAASADIGDPFENMRMGLYALRMAHRNAGVMQPIDILRLHTLRTAEVMAVAKEVGSIEPGKRADLLIVDPRFPLTGSVTDPAATLVFACSASNIERVYVGGVLRATRGVPAGHDVAALQLDVERRVERIKAAAASAQAARP